MYFGRGKDHKYTDINEVSCTSFFKSRDPKLKDTVLSKNTLLEHIKRPAYQTGWLWRECFNNVELWGWKPSFKLCAKYFPRWQQPDFQTTIKDVVATCGCKTSKCVNYKCGCLGKKCLDFRKYQRKCQSI